MPYPYTFAMLATLAVALPAPALTQPARPAPPAPRAYAAALGEFVERLRATPNAPPGTVVVVTLRGRTLFSRALGYRNLATRAPMTLDTPVYNGSVTKSYTGLLAAMLDGDGTMPLSTSLADIWPDLRLPGSIDPRGVTAAQLLSHRMPFNADALQYRGYVTGEGLDPPAVADHLAAHAQPREPVFRYANTGPVIWGTMMQVRTGLPWRDMLRRRILAPLGMNRTSASARDFPRDQLALCHARWAGAWQPTPPKPDILMSAAGGMFASGRDTARFVQLFATDGASARGRIPASTLRRTWAREIGNQQNFLGMQRDGYGLGWDLGTILGQPMVSRGGTFTGCRSVILFLPQSGLGVVVLTNGDMAGHAHNEAILAQAVDLWTAPRGAAERGAQRIADYQARAARDAVRVDARQSVLAQARPIEASLAASLAGRYVNDRLGTIAVTPAENALALRLGVSTGRVLWTGGDTFIASVEPDPGYEGVRFERDGTGNPVAFVMDDERYVRQPG